MVDFLFLGIIPGTTFQITFLTWLLGFQVLCVVVMVYSFTAQFRRRRQFQAALSAISL